MNIVEYLEDKNISYSTSGKNVSAGWIGIQCPFCGDRSNHLGIHLQTNAISCFICGKHSLRETIKALDGGSYQKAKATISKYGGGRLSSFQPQENISRPHRVDLPGDPDLQPLHSRYIQSREFDPVKMHKKYKFSCCGPIGDYALRFCVPVTFKGKTVTFVARDATGKSNLSYRNQPDEESIIPIKNILYNIDNCRSDEILVVEGLLDVWRIGDQSCSTQGIQWTKSQAKMLSGYKTVFILFDAEPQAQKKANELGGWLSAHTTVEILNLDQGDPADLSEDDVKSLRKEIFGKIY